jgi:hypothetical protein
LLNTCNSCGRGCRKYKDICVECLRKTKNRECLICGVILDSKKQKTCSVECQEKQVRLEEVQQELKSTVEDLFEGNILSVWKDGDDFFFSFSYPGVSIKFSNTDALDSFLEDIILLAHSLQCDAGDECDLENGN